MGDTNKQSNTSILTAYNDIPYALLNKELEGAYNDVFVEFADIKKYYKIYKEGSEFSPEATAGNYVAAQLRFKKAATIVKKEARFLFGEQPDVIVNPVGDVENVTDGTKKAITRLKMLIDKVFETNKFESNLIKAARDCFIGKRVAAMVNFNEDYGVTIQFLKSTNFIYETKMDNQDILEKFVAFTVVKNRSKLEDKRVFKKKFKLEYEEQDDGTTKPVCYLEEGLYDGKGMLIEQLIEYQPTMFDKIPVVLILNDGLLDDDKGISEIEELADYEQWYSKLSNADIDSERKGMHQIKYTIDMAHGSTKNLSTAPGSFWDLQSDQNNQTAKPTIGTIDNDMTYADALDKTLNRIKAAMYEEVDVPDITLENMQSVITSGKALKAVYWPLITRCAEKMKTWGPAIESIARLIIEGGFLYPNCVAKYVKDEVLSPVDYEIEIEANYPLPEDEQEEKTIDMAEVTSQVMSRKSYMKKWRKMTDSEANEELEQIALEVNMVDNGGFGNTNKEGIEDVGIEIDGINDINNQNTGNS